MAEFEDGGDNPFLKALKSYKQGTPPPQPETHTPSANNPFGDLVLKKKEVSAPASPSGVPSSNSGSKSSPVSPPSKPVDPTLNAYWSHLSADEKTNISKATAQSVASHSDESINDATDENKHYQFMQTPVGKTVGAVKYLGSQATHGGLQVIKGAAHLYNAAMNSNNPLVDISTDAVTDAADKAADFGLTKGDINNIQDGSGLYNKALSAGGMAANFAPGIMAGEATGAPKAMLYLQGVGQGKEVADKLPNLSPITKEALIQGTGAVNLILSDVGDKIFNDIPAAIKGKIASAITADAIAKTGGESVSDAEFKSLLQEGSKTFLDKLQTGGIEVAEHYADNIKTFAKLKTATFAMHKAVDLTDKAQGGDGVFNETPGTLAEGLSNVPAEALPFTAIPAFRSITKEFIDPVQNQKQQLGDQITTLDQKIKSVQPIADNEPDPVKKAEGEVAVENLTKQKEELYKKLKGIVATEHEAIQQSVSIPVDAEQTELSKSEQPASPVGASSFDAPTGEAKPVEKVDEKPENIELGSSKWIPDNEVNQKLIRPALGETKNFDIKQGKNGTEFWFKNEDERFKNNVLPVNVQVEKSNFNRIHIDGLAEELKGKGYGKEIYQSLIDKHHIISTSEYSSSPEAKKVWDSLIRSGKYHWAEVTDGNGTSFKAVSDNKADIERFIENKKNKFENIVKSSEKHFDTGNRLKVADKDAPTLPDLSRNLKPDGKQGITIEPAYQKEYGTGNSTDEPLENGNKYVVSRGENGKVNGVLEISYNGDKGEEKEPQAVKVVVEKDSQRQGIATSLFKHAEDNGIDLSKVRGKETTDAGQALLDANNAAKDTRGETSDLTSENKSLANPKQEKVNEPQGGTDGSIDPKRQKAIDAITHGIIHSPEKEVPDMGLPKGDKRASANENPRVDLGKDFDTRSRNKAVSDIIKGNYDTAPAKKMINLVMDMDSKGSYPLIAGTGGNTVRIGEMLPEDVQRHIDEANGFKSVHLTDEQLQEHNKAATELGITPQDIEDYERYQSEHPTEQQPRRSTDNRRAVEVPAGSVQRTENDPSAGSPQNQGDKAAQGSNEELTSPLNKSENESTKNGNAEENNQKETGPEKASSESVADEKGNVKEYQPSDEVADTSKAKLTKLAPKGIEEVNKAIEPNGITHEQVKAYEQSKSTAGLPADNAENNRGVQEDVRPSDVEVGDKDKNIQSETVREQPERQASSVKEQALRDKLDNAKKELKKDLREARKKTNMGLNPDLLSSFAKVIKAYADLGLHKFSEIVKDWIDTYGKENFTDEDADAFKSAYAAHVANLEPKERKNYDDLKALDKFMGDGLKVLRGQEPVASLPKPPAETKERLPVPMEEKEKKEAKEDYSWLGRFKDNRVRNLEQLKAFAKDTKIFEPLREVRKFATSKSQASVILKTATQKILQSVGKDGWQTLREALVESRLRGAKERWNNFAADIASKTDSQTKDYFADGKTGTMYDLLDNLKGLGGENPAQFASNLITAQRYADSRTYLSDVFKATADNVLTLGQFTNGKTFDEMVENGQFKDPKMQSALEAYKEYIEKPIAESHESNEGVFSDALGDLDTYYPLIPTAEEDKNFVAGAKPYKQPLNPNNRFATGQSQDYSREIADLSDTLTKSIKTNNKANAIEALKKAGLIVDVPHNEKETGFIELNGERYKAIKFKVAEGRTIVQDGQIVNTQSKYVAMPAWLERELKPIFDASSQYDQYSALGKGLNTLVKFQLGGPIEATAHSMRLLGGITNSMPFMQEWAYKNGVVGKLGGFIANNPFVKTVLGMGKILSTDLTSDSALKTIQEMAKNGDIPEKTWTKTWSREFAELTGAKASRIKIGNIDIPNFTDFSPILYGKRSLDLKARVTMYNLTKAMNPDATPEMHTKMQQQLGVYTKALQSNLEKFVKQHGIAPFYSFGSAIYREGIKAVVGSSVLPLERPSLKDAFTTGIGAKQMAKISAYKAAQLLSTGLIGTSAYWMATYHAQTGKWPWEDEKSKLLRLPFPESLRNNFTEKYFKNKATGEWDDFDFSAYANPYLNRGLRGVGAPKAYETNQLGGTGSQVAEAGFLQAANTAISPYTSSPVMQLGLNQLAGSAPYITNNRDDKGKPGIGLFRKVRTMPTFLGQQAANTEVGFQSLNPVTNFLGDAAINAFGVKSLKSKGDDGSDASTMSAFKFAMGIAFPRLFTPHGDDDTKKYFIDREEQATEKEAAKEAQ